MKAYSSQNYRRLKIREERISYTGLDSWSFALMGRWKRRASTTRALALRAEAVLVEMEKWKDRSDENIILTATSVAPQLLRRKPSPEQLVLGLACVAIASQRALGLKPYRVQLQGAAALFDGCLAEMATGEGKTLTIALAATLMALTRQPTHVVTSNDYLAERDASELAPLYRFFGLTVGFVIGKHQVADRIKGYAAAITYTTPKEVIADFLRDRLKLGRVQNPTRSLVRRLGGLPTQTSGLVLRGLHFGIIDEADSVLIDEAITPLLISRPTEDKQLVDAMKAARDIAQKLQPDRDYEPNFRFRDIHLSDELENQLGALAAQFPPWWRSPERVREALRLALMAREFYQRDIHYVVLEGKIELIDESTGRIMPHRTWQQGIHQAVETKEGLDATTVNESLASLSFQRFFRCYPRLSGLSGTAREAAAEFWQNYHLPLVVIPRNRPLLRRLKTSRVLITKKEKWLAVAEEIENLRAQGRPVLIGTKTVQASEELARILESHGVPFQLLNATRDAQEAEIISQAGQSGQVTIATNMAGRGTDIKLGPGVADKGGLHVICTERNDSGRIDRQLIGRAGRQGDPGSGRLILSLEDDLLGKFIAPAVLKPLRSGASSQGLRLGAFQYAQLFSERQGARNRKRVLESDLWLDENLAIGGQA